MHDIKKIDLPEPTCSRNLASNIADRFSLAYVSCSWQLNSANRALGCVAVV